MVLFRVEELESTYASWWFGRDGRPRRGIALEGKVAIGAFLLVVVVHALTSMAG